MDQGQTLVAYVATDVATTVKVRYVHTRVFQQQRITQIHTMADNLGATKTTRKRNVGPWQQGDNKGGYDDGGDNRPPSSPADG